AIVILPLIGSFRSRLWWLSLPLGAAAVYAINATALLARALDSDWLSLRRFAWAGALHLILELPFTGLGPGLRTVAERFAAHYALDDPHTVSHAHNVLLQAYLELGPVGFAGLATLFGFGMVAAVRAARQAQSGEERAVATGVGAALAGSLVFGLTD